MAVVVEENIDVEIKEGKERKTKNEIRYYYFNIDTKVGKEKRGERNETYGITNRPIVSGTRPVAFTAANEIGIVAADEAQAKAKICAGTICCK